MEGSCLVLDAGSGSIKGGFGGAEAPTHYRNIVGKLKYESAFPQEIDGFVSNDVEKHRGLLKLSYPVTGGHVTNWDDANKVFNYVNVALGVSCKDHPALVTEAALTSRPQRYRLAQMMFEESQHPALLFATQGLLSLYASGSTTGIVLDVGDGVMQTCPVFEGYTVREAVRRVDFGGRDVTNYLRSLLRQYGNFFDTSAEVDLVRSMKELRCHVSPSQKSDQPMKSKHRLPDGTEIIVSSELSQAPEALFNPALVGREHCGVVGIVSESIKLADVDLRRDIYQNILLAGGSTLTNGFCSRFLSEMTKLTPRDCKVRLLAPSERLHTAWIGGSFLSQLSTFKQMVVKRSDYLEEGEDIIHARLFA